MTEKMQMMITSDDNDGCNDNYDGEFNDTYDQNYQKKHTNIDCLVWLGFVGCIDGASKLAQHPRVELSFLFQLLEGTSELCTPKVIVRRRS